MNDRFLKDSKLSVKTKKAKREVIDDFLKWLMNIN
jgi:hypothetical protein